MSSPDNKDDFKLVPEGSDLGKFDVKNPVIEALMMELAQKIQGQLPSNMRFALFLFEEELDAYGKESDSDVNIFYSASARTAELLPLIETWCRRQVQ